MDEPKRVTRYLEAFTIRASAVVVVGAVLLVSNPLSAQGPPAETRPVVRGASIPLGSWVRWSQAGERREGVLMGVDGRFLRLRTGVDSLRLDVAAADSLWVLADARAVGGVIGFLIGATPVALTCGRALAGCGLIPNGILIAAAGAAVGMVVGGRVPQWRRQWP